jgi:hypothetical protein
MTPNETIIQQGELDDCAIYLISTGKVEVFFSNNNKTS